MARETILARGGRGRTQLHAGGGNLDGRGVSAYGPATAGVSDRRGAGLGGPHHRDRPHDVSPRGRRQLARRTFGNAVARAGGAGGGVLSSIETLVSTIQGYVETIRDRLPMTALA
jgi:hypothetical protein